MEPEGDAESLETRYGIRPPDRFDWRAAVAWISAFGSVIGGGATIAWFHDGFPGLGWGAALLTVAWLIGGPWALVQGWRRRPDRRPMYRTVVVVWCLLLTPALLLVGFRALVWLVDTIWP